VCGGHREAGERARVHGPPRTTVLKKQGSSLVGCRVWRLGAKLKPSCFRARGPQVAALDETRPWVDERPRSGWLIVPGGGAVLENLQAELFRVGRVGPRRKVKSRSGGARSHAAMMLRVTIRIKALAWAPPGAGPGSSQAQRRRRTTRPPVTDRVLPRRRKARPGEGRRGR